MTPSPADLDRLRRAVGPQTVYPSKLISFLVVVIIALAIPSTLWVQEHYFAPATAPQTALSPASPVAPSTPSPSPTAVASTPAPAPAAASVPPPIVKVELPMAKNTLRVPSLSEQDTAVTPATEKPKTVPTGLKKDGTAAMRKVTYYVTGTPGAVLVNFVDADGSDVRKMVQVGWKQDVYLPLGASFHFGATNPTLTPVLLRAEVYFDDVVYMRDESTDRQAQVFVSGVVKTSF